MIGLRNLFHQQSHRQKSRAFDSSPTSLPLVPAGERKSVFSFLPSVQHKREERQFGDGWQSTFGKIQSSTLNLWVLLMMIPFVQRALNWHAEKQIRVKNLQDQCIQKAYRELWMETRREGEQLFRETWQENERLKTRAIANRAKQYYHDLGLAQNLESWKLAQENFQANINRSEKIYRTISNEKELKRHLALPRHSFA